MVARIAILDVRRMRHLRLSCSSKANVRDLISINAIKEVQSFQPQDKGQETWLNQIGIHIVTI
jgi:hypothetical protein